jgi:hypothetical protein
LTRYRAGNRPIGYKLCCFSTAAVAATGIDLPLAAC